MATLGRVREHLANETTMLERVVQDSTEHSPTGFMRAINPTTSSCVAVRGMEPYCQISGQAGLNFMGVVRC